MLKKISNQNLHCGDYEWHVCRHHFSFADYHDPENMNFGLLRALNDEIVQPSYGFHPHPHDNMEIVSYCVQGELSHSDDSGNEQTLERGDVQHLCTGSGIVHSEMNRSNMLDLRFIQIWIFPNQSELTPSYAYRKPPKELRQNSFLRIASGTGSENSIRINQDVDIYVSEINKGKSIRYSLPRNRQSYLLCIEGSIDIDQVRLEQHEAVEIFGEVEFKVSAVENGHLIMVEMPEGDGGEIPSS
jgi:hypothetical protein